MSREQQFAIAKCLPDSGWSWQKWLLPSAKIYLFVRANINLKRSTKGRSRRGITLHSSAHPQHQPLQIRPLRKTQRHRMIGAGVQVMDDLRVHPGIECGTGDDLLEQVFADAAGAGVGGEQAARPEQLEGEQVDVLVAARGFFGERGGGGELGRVEDDEIEGAALVAQFAQRLEYIRFLPFGAG